MNRGGATEGSREDAETGREGSVRWRLTCVFIRILVVFWVRQETASETRSSLIPELKGAKDLGAAKGLGTRPAVTSGLVYTRRFRAGRRRRWVGIDSPNRSNRGIKQARPRQTVDSSTIFLDKLCTTYSVPGNCLHQGRGTILL